MRSEQSRLIDVRFHDFAFSVRTLVGLQLSWSLIGRRGELMPLMLLRSLASKKKFKRDLATN